MSLFLDFICDLDCIAESTAFVQFIVLQKQSTVYQSKKIDFFEHSVFNVICDLLNTHAYNTVFMPPLRANDLGYKPQFCPSSGMSACVSVGLFVRSSVCKLIHCLLPLIYTRYSVLYTWCVYFLPMGCAVNDGVNADPVVNLDVAPVTIITKN